MEYDASRRRAPHLTRRGVGKGGGLAKATLAIKIEYEELFFDNLWLAKRRGRRGEERCILRFPDIGLRIQI